MSFQVRSEQRPVKNGLDNEFYVLESSQGATRAEIWPALGFNCCGWRAELGGQACSLLYAAPNIYEDTRPTRSGIPILFPFPNRIRDGRFDWHGQTYPLTKNDSNLKNAIHGFACRSRWRIIDQGAGEQEAWLTGEFWASQDNPEALRVWPADHRIRLTYRLSRLRLRLEAVVDNPGNAPLPFGLGFHPYFCIPLVGNDSSSECVVDVDADRFWELSESLPTGKLLPVDAGRDLTKPRPYSELQLDDVLAARKSASDQLRKIGSVAQRAVGVQLQVWADPAFHTIVVFTPAHRQAFCIEPYTCTTDAINLQARGVDAGMLVLAPGESWRGTVELRVGAYNAC